MTPKLHNSKAWLYKRFITQNKTIIEIAAEAKVSEMTIRRALQRQGLL